MNIFQLKKTSFWLLVSFMCVLETAWAETLSIEVSTHEDQFNNGDDECSIREAIETVNFIAEYEGAIEIPECFAGDVPDELDMIQILLEGGTYEIGEDFIEEEEELGNRAGDFFIYTEVDVTFEPGSGEELPVIFDAQFRDRLFTVDGDFEPTLSFRKIIFRNGKPSLNILPYESDGGAIRTNFTNTDVILKVVNCNFENNQTSIIKEENRWVYGNGGAISANKLIVHNSIFIGNSVDLEQPNEAGDEIDRIGGNGGAINQIASRILQIEGSRFEQNQAIQGGVIFSTTFRNEGVISSIRHSDFIENRSEDRGAVLRISIGEIEGNLFRNNSSHTKSTIEIINAAQAVPVTIRNNTFYQNENSSVISVFLHESRIDEHETPVVTFNTIVLNAGSVFSAEGLGEIQFGANLILNAVQICQYPVRNNFQGSIESIGFNLWSGNFNCDSNDPTDLAEIDTLEQWADVIEPFDNERGFFPIVKHGLAHLVIPRDHPLCEDIGTDQLGHHRPAGNGCDLGSVEFGSMPPVSEGAGGGGGEFDEEPLLFPLGGDMGNGEPVGGFGGEPVEMDPAQSIGGIEGEEDIHGGAGGGPDPSGVGGNPFDISVGGSIDPEPSEPDPGRRNPGRGIGDPVDTPMGGSGGDSEGEGSAGFEEQMMSPAKTSSNGCQCAITSFVGSYGSGNSHWPTPVVMCGGVLAFLVRLFRRRK